MNIVFARCVELSLKQCWEKLFEMDIWRQKQQQQHEFQVLRDG